MSEHVYLPALLQEIAEVAGLGAALAIAEAKGGERVVIPARARDDHWLVTVAGREAANALCQHFRVTQKTGMEHLIPMGPRNMYVRARRKFVWLVESGVSVEEAGRRVGIHLRSARRYRARMKDRARMRTNPLPQGSLF